MFSWFYGWNCLYYRGVVMIFAGKNEIEAKEKARKASIDNKGKYITLYACFGIYMQISKRFNIHDPSDSLFGAYWLNGKEKAFTDAQIIRDEQATPSLY